jgi:hypothetical protein
VERRTSYGEVRDTDFIGLGELQAAQFAEHNGIVIHNGGLFDWRDRIVLEHRLVAGSENRVSLRYSEPVRHPGCDFCQCARRARTVVDATFGTYRCWNPDGSIDYA